jgi:aspartyl-tRNA(Asn)/glutamyl-tRNA(Gln) amidotransferase subunit B
VGRSGEEVSLIDYNRSGIPLVEIVTAPDIESPSEARDFLTDLLIELRHLVGITEQDEQTVRVDANISIQEERVEVKNITGLKNLERALKFEASRQSKLLKAGKTIVRETRRYDEERGVTLPSREKEFEEDYGYIGDPDLGVFDIGHLAREMGKVETPLARVDRLCRLHAIDRQTARQIILTSWKLADLFEYLCESSPPEKVIPWLLGPISSNWEDLLRNMSDQTKRQLADIIAAVAMKEMTDIEGRKRIEALALGGEFRPAEEMKTEEELESLIVSLVDKHPEAVKDYRSNEKAANFLIGQLMKATQGKYQSRDVVEKVRKELERRIKEE